jgi:hypothetical protein
MWLLVSTMRLLWLCWPALGCRGWSLTELNPEASGSVAVGTKTAVTIGGKLGAKFTKAKAGDIKQSQKHMVTYAYAPAWHLLPDLGPGSYRPVSVLLLRDPEALRFCDSSGRELGKYLCRQTLQLSIVSMQYLSV